jgi:hypothetical protein
LNAVREWDKLWDSCGRVEEDFIDAVAKAVK